MKRLRWLEAQIPISVRSLANKLKSRPFTEEGSDGFLVDRVRDSHIEARYVEKLAIVDTVVDPLGRELSFERVDYRQTEFRITSEYPQVELTNPPRGIQSFSGRLSELTDFSLSLSPIVVNVLRWADNFSRLYPDRFMVDALQASGISVEENVTAKVILNGTVDVRRALRRFTNGRRPELDRLQARFGLGREETSVVLLSEGAARVSADPAQEVITALRESLALLRE